MQNCHLKRLEKISVELSHIGWKLTLQECHKMAVNINVGLLGKSIIHLKLEKSTQD